MMFRQMAIAVAGFGAAAASAAAQDRPQGPIGPAQASPPPEPRFGPIGPAHGEGPQGRDVSGIGGFTAEAAIVRVLFDSGLRLEDRYGARGRIYFPLTDVIDGTVGATLVDTLDETQDESVTVFDGHVGAFTRRYWDWERERFDLHGGVVVGGMRFNGADPEDTVPFAGLEGGVRWHVAVPFYVSASYSVAATWTDANRRGGDTQGVVNHSFTLGFGYEF